MVYGLSEPPWPDRYRIQCKKLHPSVDRFPVWQAFPEIEAGGLFFGAFAS